MRYWQNFAKHIRFVVRKCIGHYCSTKQKGYFLTHLILTVNVAVLRNLLEMKPHSRQYFCYIILAQSLK